MVKSSPLQPDLHIGLDGLPYSKQFNDLYFSRDNGMAESEYLFMEGNDLPRRFSASGNGRIFIAELGFGSGLNFAVTLKSWEQYAKAGSYLHYMGIDQYPLSRAQILDILGGWPQLAAQVNALCNHYPTTLQSHHQLHISPSVTLTLIFSEALEGLQSLPHKIDAWYLDGFAPAKNPEMWRPELLALIHGQSNPGATFATFTAAAQVRRDMEVAHFVVRKRAGFGRKRECLVGYTRAHDLMDGQNG